MALLTMVLYLLWQRFREAGLWHADPERYFQGKYLALNFSLPPQLVDSAWLGLGLALALTQP